ARRERHARAPARGYSASTRDGCGASAAGQISSGARDGACRGLAHPLLPAMWRRSRGGKVLQRMRRAAFRIGARRGAGRAMTAALIEARALGKSFGPTPVLRDVNLSVEAGRGAAVVGANGAGKSTLIRLL